MKLLVRQIPVLFYSPRHRVLSSLFQLLVVAKHVFEVPFDEFLQSRNRYHYELPPGLQMCFGIAKYYEQELLANLGWQICDDTVKPHVADRTEHIAEIYLAVFETIDISIHLGEIDSHEVLID